MIPLPSLVHGAAMAGILLLIAGGRRVAPPLVELTDRLRPGPVPARPSIIDRWEAALMAAIGMPEVCRRRRADLLLMDRAAGEWRRRRIVISVAVAAAVATALPTLVSVMRSGSAGTGVGAAGGGLGPLTVGGWAVVAGAGAGVACWGSLGVALARQAEKRRRIHRHGISLLLDLAAVAMAGGAGPAQAMRDAAARGDGQCFRRIRSTLAAAEAARVPPFEALHRLGDALAIPELTEAVAAMMLADRKGAPVRRTLDHKTESILVRLMREEEAAAASRSVTMSLPSVLMLAGFLLFLMYPFMAALVATTR